MARIGCTVAVVLLGGRAADLEQAVDGVGRQHALENHYSCPDYTRLVPQSAGADFEVTCRQCRRPLIDDLADSSEQLLIRRGNIAAHHNYVGVEEVHYPGQHLTDEATSVTNESPCGRVAIADVADDITTRAGLQPKLHQLSSERGASG
jgi:hypothetical protein